jgi:glycosyltransferase involved in cell wall biosynthesis
MILHITPNAFRHSSRILKECDVAFGPGHNVPVQVVALWEPGVEREEVTGTGVKVWRVALATRNWPRHLLIQPIKYVEWLSRIVSRFRRERITLIHAHNVAGLPVGVILKWLTRAPLVYDAHELESERNGISRLRNRLSGLAERIWIRAADATITVSDGIADWYEEAYGIDRPAVVRNIPVRAGAPAQRSRVLRETHGIPDDAVLFIYQGALSRGRGIEQIVEIFSDTEMKNHLVVMGYGALENTVVEAADRCPNIHFQPAVAPQDVLHYTSSADIGLCLIENTCLSYYYSLPNKLFEYLLCGLPVIVNDLPEQRKIVEAFDCGWTAPSSLDASKAMIAAIDAGALATRKRGAEHAASELDWNNEAARMTAVYLDVSAGKN